LKQQWERARDDRLVMLAALRADLHNTSARDFQRRFDIEDFMSSRVAGIEQRAQQLIEQGYTPSEAAALASSRQTSEHKLHLVRQAGDAAHAAKQRGGRKARAR
jgi:hypothetical protein